jgi:hypothetical protein
VVHLPLAARSGFVAGTKALVKVWRRGDARASDGKISRERLGTAERDGVGHFDAFQDGRFV